MKLTNLLFITCLCVLFINACPIRDAQASSKTAISYSKVDIAYPNDECSFKYSPVDFCDDRHIKEYNSALNKKSENFNHNYIIIPIKEWGNDEKSLVAIDKRDGIVYPVPIDSYSGFPSEKGSPQRNAKLQFSKESNQVCILGRILVYRATETGKFCFRLEGDKFVGYHTTYMGNDKP